MIPLNATLKGDFQRRLVDRAAAWRGTRIAFRIRVPPELSWWYWQEWGTAERGEAGRASGHTYDIYPVTAQALSFTNQQGETIQTGSVVGHEGIFPKRLVSSILYDIRDQLSIKTHDAFLAGAMDDPALLKNALSTGTEQAREQIILSIADKLPEGRAEGRLKGDTAANVFAAQSEVVDVSNEGI